MWVSFNVLCGVGLSAGGFTLCAVVYVLNARRYKPLVRPVVLAALLGYISVVLTLLIELGRPLNIWHTLVMWNHHSVLFEVSWCVMLYSTVLLLEFSPVVLEGLKFRGLLSLVKAITVPLVIAGILLSTLHQSSLGSLFLLVPGKLHALWYSPQIPVFFFLSALGIGAAMTIIVSLLCSHAFRRTAPTELLRDVSRWMVVVMLIYLAARILDYGRRGLFPMLLDGSLEACLVWAELGLMVLLPIVVLSVPKFGRGNLGLFSASACAVLGFVLNRFDVSFFGIPQIRNTGYVPSLMELSMTAGIIAGLAWVFNLAVKFFPVFDEHAETETTVAERMAAPVPARPVGPVRPQAVPAASGAGALNWPGVLRHPRFAEHRAMIEAPLQRSGEASGGPTADDYHMMLEVTEQMKRTLRELSRELSPHQVQGTETHLDQFAGKIRARLGRIRTL
jgi:Ni/Fe-hydrogenase subunit HybB-like protein